MTRASDYSDLQSRLRAIETIVHESRTLSTILRRTPELSLAHWYLGAGCIAQTVWNRLSGRDPLEGIKDADLVYFDGTDLSSASEARNIDSARQQFSDLPLPIDVKNQARVHLWYEGRFGYPIQPYRSVEEAIDTWPTTATAVAVRHDDTGAFRVYAPFGLDDLFNMIVRPNRIQITEDIYMKKVTRWKACWPGLEIIPW